METSNRPPKGLIIAAAVVGAIFLCLIVYLLIVKPEMSYACDPTKPAEYPKCIDALKAKAGKKCSPFDVACLVSVVQAQALLKENPPANLQVNWRCRAPGSDPTTDICIFKTTKAACTSPCVWCTQDPTTKPTGVKGTYNTKTTPVSKSFTADNNFLTFDPKTKDLVIGNQISTVDSSINTVASGVTTALADTYQPKSEMGDYQPTDNMCAWEQKADWITQADMKKYELWNPHLADKSKTIYMANAAKGNNWYGNYGDRGGFYDNNTKGQSYNHWTFSN
tara:strand:- start:24 stop:860 length:837 start_codon:yes stop_codon:yes gene_type:complete